MSDTKTCPFCAEDIKAAAIKCKHCGETLEGKATALPVSHDAAPAPVPEAVPRIAKCPYCAEHVPWEALRCKFCHKTLHHRTIEIVGKGMERGKSVGKPSSTADQWKLAGAAVVIGLIIGILANL